jgi:hypothetical protein
MSTCFWSRNFRNVLRHVAISWLLRKTDRYHAPEKEENVSDSALGLTDKRMNKNSREVGEIRTCYLQSWSDQYPRVSDQAGSNSKVSLERIWVAADEDWLNADQGPEILWGMMVLRASQKSLSESMVIKGTRVILTLSPNECSQPVQFELKSFRRGVIPTWKPRDDYRKSPWANPHESVSFLQHSSKLSDLWRIPFGERSDFLPWKTCHIHPTKCYSLHSW